jgi:DNA helicase HerA-like ATPase
MIAVARKGARMGSPARQRWRIALEPRRQQQIGRVLCVSGSQVVMAMAGADDPTRLQKGDLVKLRLPGTTVFGIVSGLSIPVPAQGPGDGEAWLAELELIGEMRAEGGEKPVFHRGISAFPALGDQVTAVSRDDLAQVYAPAVHSTVRIGTVHLHQGQPVLISPDDLLGKHFAILGTTGCGKSCAVSLILHRILEQHPQAHILVLDPHDEYTQAFQGVAEILGPESLQLPYWLLNAEEIASVVVGEGKQRSRHDMAAVAILNELVPLAKTAYQKDRFHDLHITADTPIPYRMTDVVRLLDDAMGRLEKPESLAPYRWLKSRLEILSADARFAFMFGGIAIQDNMTRILSQLFRIPVDGKPMTIIDLSGVPSEVLNVVVSVVCRTTFDFALWSRGAQPILLVCEEAHRYAPADPSLGFEPTKNALARIAKEGRKYGVSLCIVSQRPSEVAPTILSQCNTTFAFRMTNLRDQELVRGASSDGAYGLLDFLPSLGDAEAIVAGEGVALPLRMRFDRLAPEQQPRSGTARFSSAWQGEGLDQSFVADVVDCWRRQQR